MKLSNSFAIDQPPAVVFDAFLDIEGVATCMPGSRLLGNPEPDTYEGEVKVKVGPLGVTYSGQFKILDADREQLRLTMRAKGRETRGAGNADAYIVAQMSQQNGGTLVEIDTELSIRGKVAQFGGGMIGEVTDGIMQTFARNVEQMLASGGAAAQPAGRLPGPPSVVEAGATSRPGSIPAQTPAANADGIDVWEFVVRPLLQRHAGAIATVALSGLAAYLGARAGARHGGSPATTATSSDRRRAR